MTRLRYIVPILFLTTTPVAAQVTFTELTSKPVPVHFRCDNGHTQPGDSVYVVGSSKELGQWDPAKAVRLTDVSAYPTWKGTLQLSPSWETLEWKCIIRSETGSTVKSWQPDPNNRVKVAADANSTGAF